ncbi:MAG: VIT domain-containing protein [Acidobacteriota bacterium]
MKRVTTVALVFTLCSAPAAAGVLLPDASPQAPLKIRKESIAITVSNQVMQTRVDQVFENQSAAEVDATFVQRLPVGAAVSGFATWVAGRRVESRVQEKAKAAETYARARRSGGAPALLAQLSKGAFSMKVARIGAGQTRRIEVRYEGILDYRAGTISLTVPLRPPDTVEIPREELRLVLEITDAKEITAVRPTFLPLRAERLSPSHWRLTYEARAAKTVRDLQLQYDVRSRDLGLTFLTHHPAGDDGYFMLLAAPQELTQDRDIVKKDVVFVFDTSGSMAGEKIRQAQGALKKCLSFMNRGDRFGIVAFSDATSPYRSTLQPLGTVQVREAEAFIDRLETTGGTNIHLALREGIKLLGEGADRPRVIVFLTDGLATAGITDSQVILEAIKSVNGRSQARIFTFGVGADVNRPFLERLGQENRGAGDFIERGAALEQTVAEFYAKIARPVLSDLVIDFGSVPIAMTYPNVLPDLYKGSQLLLLGRYRGSGKMKAHLSGALNGAHQRYPFPTDFPARSGENSFLARLWAQKRIDYLLAQMRMHGAATELRAEIVRLALQYHLATPYTSLVAAPETRIASLSPARVKPGDPEIRIRAPREARAVTLVFPFGLTKSARYEPDLDLWTVRFLIPRGTPDGAHTVTIFVVGADGTQETHQVSYTVDTLAPAVKLSIAGLLTPGGEVTLSARQIVTERELRQAPGSPAKLRRLRRLYAQLMTDARSVQVRLPSGEVLKLQRREAGLWSATWRVPVDLAPGSYALQVTAIDVAGNRSTAPVTMTVSR